MAALIREFVFLNVLADLPWIKCCLGPNLSHSYSLEACGVSAEVHLYVCVHDRHLITS